MPRTEAVDGPIQSPRHARAILQKMLRHRDSADKANLDLSHKPPWHDDRAVLVERCERNMKIADEAQSRLEAWMDGLTKAEKGQKRSST